MLRISTNVYFSIFPMYFLMLVQIHGASFLIFYIVQKMNLKAVKILVTFTVFFFLFGPDACVFQIPIRARLVTSHVSSASRSPSRSSCVTRARMALSYRRTRSSPRVRRRIRARCPSSGSSMTKPTPVGRPPASQPHCGVLSWLSGSLVPPSDHELEWKLG